MTAARTPQVGETWTRNQNGWNTTGTYTAAILITDGDWIGYRTSHDAYAWAKADTFSDYFDPPVLFPQIPDEFWLRAYKDGSLGNDTHAKPSAEIDGNASAAHAGWIKVQVVERRERQS